MYPSSSMNSYQPMWMVFNLYPTHFSDIRSMLKQISDIVSFLYLAQCDNPKDKDSSKNRTTRLRPAKMKNKDRIYPALPDIIPHKGQNMSSYDFQDIGHQAMKGSHTWEMKNRWIASSPQPSLLSWESPGVAQREGAQQRQMDSLSRLFVEVIIWL